ncbi:MAG: ATP-binding protein [Archangiaceae bacterium]|nr:ATP-binding protein [Archangiaceae bacterium]
MTAPATTSGALHPFVAWVGARAPSMPGLRVARFDSVETVGRSEALPSVLVLVEADDLPLEECLVQASLPSFSAMAVVVVVRAWSEALSWRGAQAGAFCCVPASLSADELRAALEAAVSETVGRRRRLMPPHDLRQAGRCLERASFAFKSLDDAETLAVLISGAMPDSARRLGGVLELLVNAVEHGSLGVGAIEKRQLLLSGQLHAELERRSKLAPYASRVARASLERLEGRVRLTITDEGEGFDFEKVLTSTPDLMAPHGRGIYLARAMSFDRLRYEGRGNVVVAEVDVP